MRTFLVVVKDDDECATFAHRVGEHFGEVYEVVPGSVWFVADKSPTTTCDEIVARIRSNSEPNDPTVFAITVEEYFGYANRPMWDKLEAWDRHGQ